MRVDTTFGSDGTDYWIRRWMVYDDGTRNPGWVTFKGPLFKSPLDEPMEADVRLIKGKGDGKLELRVDGMRIHAFHRGSGPAPLTGCTPPVPLDADAIAAEQLAEYRATFSDEEWARYLETRDPRIQRDSGVCFESTYSFVDQRQGSAGSIAEKRWCTAPPRRELIRLEYREDVIDVEVWETSVQAPRDMPPAGWNCPTDRVRPSGLAGHRSATR